MRGIDQKATPRHRAGCTQEAQNWYRRALHSVRAMFLS
jgi:hypothetical protein